MKSQALHNFSLPGLKWAMNHAKNHRFRRQASHEGNSDSENRKKNLVTGAEKNAAAGSSSPLGPKTEKLEKKKLAGGSAASSGADHAVESSEKKSATPDGRSKILIRIRAKSQKPAEEAADTGDQSLNAEEADAKTWNLRPRRPILKPPNAGGGGGGVKVGRLATQEIKNPRSESTRPRNQAEGKAAAEKKEKKPRFSVSLSREEIEEDIFAMTGSRASRRPKKRAKNVQKQIDSIYPGMWLNSVTPDLYEVPDPAAKAAGLD